MNPFSGLPREQIRAVFSDLDDTLTEGGKLSPETHEALSRLSNAGLRLVIVSGRPAGWADCLMRLLPLDAMIFENGAGLFTREKNGGIRNVLLAQDSDLNAQRARLSGIFERLKAKHPELRLAKDQPYRLFDFALDFAEDEPHIPQSTMDAVLGELEREKNITAKLSSIHVNFWCGHYTKVTACEHWLKTSGKTLGVTRDQVVFSGDSPNDEPLFEYFPHSVGVANIADFVSRLTHRPRYVTSRRGGLGFQELANFLLGG